jgi:hypothetical protein
MRKVFVSLLFGAISFSLSPSALAQNEVGGGRSGVRAPQEAQGVSRLKGRKRANGKGFTPPAKLQLPAGWEQKGLQKPAPLPVIEKQRMMGGSGAMNLYATLSLMNPKVEGKAEITAWNPVMVTSSEGQTVAMFTNQEWNTLDIKINAEAGQSLFLVDCAVDTFGKSTAGFNSYSIHQQGEGGQTLSAKNGHVLFLLETPAAGWYEVTLRNSAVGWVFHQCEVTLVK